MNYSLTDIAQLIGAELCLKNPEKTSITGVQALDKATGTEISFLANEQYRSSLAQTNPAAVIVTKDDTSMSRLNTLVVDNPQRGFVQAASLFSKKANISGIHPTAFIETGAKIDTSVAIGANCVIGKHVNIAKNVVIDAGAVIEDNVNVDEGSHIKANVSLCRGVEIGKRCIIESGAVIGADGFGNVQDKGRWYKIPQLGTVIIGDDVQIGANTTIDRGTINNTEILAGARLDNLIQVAHNVSIGAHTAIAAGTGIAGSTKIGSYCQIGGQVGIGGHLTIADKVMITGMTMVTKSITKPGVYSSGMPARKREVWHKNMACFQRITHLLARIKTLEKHLGLPAKGVKK